jgi:CspA family cold shock protein
VSDDYAPEGGDTGLIEAKVKWYNGRKGFGFVLGPDGQDVFFHASALTDAGIDQPDTDDILVCEIGSDRQGRRLVTRITELKRGPGGGGGARGGFGDRPPRRDFGGPPGGGGGFGDRPPRRDFGGPPGGGFGDRGPPRRDFGAPGGFGDRPPRRDFGGPPGGGFGAPRGPGGFGGGGAGGDRGPRRNFDEGTGPVYPLNGTVKWFDQVRGFGFVTPEDGGQDVFLHSSVLTRAGRTDLAQGEKVSLDVRDGQRGRQAVGMK